jgi:predicted phage terminase large subunit-like protein
MPEAAVLVFTECVITRDSWVPKLRYGIRNISRSPKESSVLNVVNKHLDAAATEAEIRRQRDVHRPIGAVLIEDKANGPAVIQRLKLNIPGVIEINPQGGKIARMFAAAAEWQAADWFVDRNAACTEPLIEQLTMFPNGRTDDMADMMSQASAWLLKRDIVTVSFSTVRL